MAVAHRLGIDEQARAAYMWLHRAWYGETRTIDVGPASATIRTEHAPELGNVVNVKGQERPIARRIVTALDDDDVFWDVGANVGTFACLAGSVLEDGTVVAFEPYPPNVERLRDNLERNGVSYRIEPRALSDSAGERTFFVVDSYDPGTREGSIDEEYAGVDRAAGTTTVEATTGDDVVEEGVAPPPNVVKIDVEGAAPQVIDGMSTTLARPECRLLVVEPHDNKDEIVTLVDDAGFRPRIHFVEGASRIVGVRPD